MLLLLLCLLLLCQSKTWVVVDVRFRVREHFHQASVITLHRVLRMMMSATQCTVGCQLGGVRVTCVAHRRVVHLLGLLMSNQLM